MGHEFGDGGEIEMAERFRQDGDDYSAILATSLADRLAEALAEALLDFEGMADLNAWLTVNT